MANRNFPNGKSIFIPHVKPVLVDCNFIVDSANGNGLGIRSLKGSYVANIFMNTSAPLAGSGNPNPQAGVIVVQLADNYQQYLGGFSGQSNPLSGSNTATLTATHPYVITSLGASTAAQWATAGLPANITPAVGASFIAAANIAGGGLCQALLTAGSGFDHMELVGDPAASNSNNPQPGSGLQMIFACYKNTALTAPTDGTVISMSFYINDSKVPVGSST